MVGGNRNSAVVMLMWLRWRVAAMRAVWLPFLVLSLGSSLVLVTVSGRGQLGLSWVMIG